MEKLLLNMVYLIQSILNGLDISLNPGGLTLGLNSSQPRLPLEHEWWGPSEMKGHQDTSIRPFRIKFDDEMIHDLKARLKHHREFAPPLEGAAFTYGFNTDILEDWLTYWAERYRFKSREQLLNKFPMYKTNIQGLDIHFIRVRPKVPPSVETVPLLLLHGWPGSVREFFEAIPLLTAVNRSGDFAVEVIVPSLPGFAFSDAAARPGLGPAQVAVIFNNLMRRLGHKRYYVQGGDFGAIIGGHMATQYPQNIMGFHSNFAVVMTPLAFAIQAVGSLHPPLVVEPALAGRMYPLWKKVFDLTEEMGYFHEQATKPDTIGVGLTDSPAALLVYILEKFSSATKITNKRLHDGGLNSMKPDPLLDNLMIYWSSRAITSSLRLYAETFNKKHYASGLEGIQTQVPTWVIQDRYECIYQPPVILKTRYPNLIHATILDYGGHFLAFELPEVFAEDLLKALTAFRKLHRTEGQIQPFYSNQPKDEWNSSITRIIRGIQQAIEHPEAWWIRFIINITVAAVMRIVLANLKHFGGYFHL